MDNGRERSQGLAEGATPELPSTLFPLSMSSFSLLPRLDDPFGHFQSYSESGKKKSGWTEEPPWIKSLNLQCHVETFE